MCSMTFGVFACQKIASSLQVLDPRLGAFKRKRDECLTLCLQTRTPEVTLDFNRIEWNRTKGIVGKCQADEKGKHEGGA